MLKELRTKAMALPMNPGVYFMYDKTGKVIYIGKAKALKNRVSQYFGSDRQHQDKVKRMVLNVHRFDYIVTDSEFEALVLENSQIKQYQPKYNILLKDDKGYSYIKITNDEWPKIMESKQILKDGAKYIGPYMSSWSIKQTIDEAQKIFRLPSCNKQFPRDFGKSRPCLNFYIKQCDAPCSGKLKKKVYLENINEALEFIKGGSSTSTQNLTARMEQAAENLDFELAARIRDRISAIKKMGEKQKVVASKIKEQDVIGIASSGDKAVVAVLKFQENRLFDREDFVFTDVDSLEELRGDFVRQYYDNRDRIPPQITLDGVAEDMELHSALLSEKTDRKVLIHIPQRGEQLQLVEMCKKNAAEKLAQGMERTGKEISALDELGRLLGLSVPPAYIESYDISNLSGGENVAGMVVFENGRPLKSAYRKFKIKTVVGQDDYGSMREVIERRFREYFIHKDENIGFGRMPDLILLDGGKGHVGAIAPVLKNMGVEVALFGMVKDDKHRTRAITGNGGEIAINSSRKAFTLVSNIQDEVHRFAIGYHRQQRKKSTISSTLTSIEGVGESRAKALMKHFKTIKAIKEADLVELQKAPGMNKTVGKKVFDYFNEQI